MKQFKIAKLTIVYYYRGQIERCRKAGRYNWYDGYSAEGTHGALQPWMTRTECRADAKMQGASATFERKEHRKP